MTHLQVTVRLLGRIVDSELCAVAHGLRFGDIDGAVVAFAGLAVKLERGLYGWLVHGQLVGVGRTVVFRLGEVEVTFEGVRARRQHRWPLAPHHVRVAFAMAAAVLLVAWVDSLEGVVDANPDLAERLEALVLAPPQRVSQDEVVPEHFVLPVTTVPDADRLPAEWRPATERVLP